MAERRYLAVDPDNRLVARGLGAECEKALRALAAAAELARREAERPKTLTAQEKTAILALGANVPAMWGATSTTDRDRKELLRTLLEEVIISVDKTAKRADLTRAGGAEVPAEQTTPGAPWRFRLTDDLRGRFVENTPDGYLPMLEATHAQRAPTNGVAARQAGSARRRPCPHRTQKRRRPATGRGTRRPSTTRSAQTREISLLLRVIGRRVIRIRCLAAFTTADAIITMATSRSIWPRFGHSSVPTATATGKRRRTYSPRLG